MPQFSDLNTDSILDAVESVIQEPLTALCRPYNSYINRVFELQTRAGRDLIAKLYRPGRWSDEAILDEHEFLFDLQDEDVPVIAPIEFDGDSLFEVQGIYFALFPKKGGRTSDEYSLTQWQELGRLLGRTHMVGSRVPAEFRETLHPEHNLQAHVQSLLEHDTVPTKFKHVLENLSRNVAEASAEAFGLEDTIRLHGDCHHANILYRPEENFFLIDFDDMTNGPAIQDVWMLLPGTVQECERELGAFLEGYTVFQPYQPQQFKLIETLRFMRIVHYQAWCLRQFESDGEVRAVVGYGTDQYWNEEIRALYEQSERIATY